MRTAKHTPGPWERLTFSNHELQADFAMVKIGERVHMVGYSGGDWANARLIAAAPELLEALEMVMRRGRIDDSEEAMNQVAAAIAKAKGES